MAKTPHEIYLAVNGRAFDVDGYYGPQCWDGVMYVNRTYWGGSVHSCGGDTYVYNLWTNRRNNGMLNDFVEVPMSQAQDGDVFIWAYGAAECPYSHIAIFRKWDNSGKTRATFLGQNQGGAGGAFNQTSISVSGVMGVLRPKCYVQQAASVPTSGADTKKVGNLTVTLENGTATFLKNNINVRDGGPNGKVVAQYNAGQSVNYWGKWVGNGHRYIFYTSYSGATRCVAVSGSETHGVDPWATFK